MSSSCCKKVDGGNAALVRAFFALFLRVLVCAEFIPALERDRGGAGEGHYSGSAQSSASCEECSDLEGDKG